MVLEVVFDISSSHFSPHLPLSHCDVLKNICALTLYSNSSGAPPPPPPPPPIGGAKIPTWREQQEAKLPAQQQIQQIQNDQYSNLPPQLMNSMNKDKKPFTYTPLAVG